VSTSQAQLQQPSSKIVDKFVPVRKFEMKIFPDPTPEELAAEQAIIHPEDRIKSGLITQEEADAQLLKLIKSKQKQLEHENVRQQQLVEAEAALKERASRVQLGMNLMSKIGEVRKEVTGAATEVFKKLAESKAQESLREYPPLPEPAGKMPIPDAAPVFQPKPVHQAPAPFAALSKLKEERKRQDSNTRESGN
jgi:hypothetical protein